MDRSEMTEEGVPNYLVKLAYLYLPFAATHHVDVSKLVNRCIIQCYPFSEEKSVFGRQPSASAHWLAMFHSPSGCSFKISVRTKNIFLTF